MKNRATKVISVLLLLVMVAGLLPAVSLAAGWDGTAAAEAPEGSGTAEEPYQITDAADLKWFADAVNGSANKSTSTLCAKLMNSIDLENQEWTPIGYRVDYSTYVYYGGTFDGGGFTVSGLFIDSSSAYQALFGYVKGAAIQNLTVSGSVETSSSSSAYAAGIVGSGDPVTMENCTSNVKVTATSKGYVAGLSAYASSGSVFTGCVNNGDITGKGEYVGGIAANASGTSFSNCFNHGTITSTGAPNSYSYGVGGIAGIAGSNSAIAMCGNTGAVRSTLKSTGGIAGRVAGTVSKCFNTGTVTGIYELGGILGASGGAATAVISCYNTGDVICQAPSSAFTDASGNKGIGGIVGDVSSSSYKAALSACYNVGSVVNNDSTTEGLAIGGIAGNSSGKNYSGVVTAENLITAENCHYLAGTAVQGDGYAASASGMAAKSEEEMKAADFAAQLGSDYIAQTNGYPILGWQDPDAEYTVEFSLTPSDAVLEVKDSAQNTVEPESGTTYKLKNGNYTYAVYADEYVAKKESFTVAYGGQSISVSLSVKKYDYVFTTEPAEAVLTVDGQTPLADGRTYPLAKAGNPYRYSVSAFGYETANGQFHVTGNADTDKQTVTLTEKDRQTVTFGAVTAEDSAPIVPVISVSSVEWPQAAITAENGVYRLPAGNYSYTISCSGYKTVHGSFAVSTQAVSIPAVTMEIQTAWDGITYTEPLQKDEVYQIGSADELMWFHKNAALTASAVLTADININEDVAVEDKTSLSVWTPKGTTSSNAYTGTFDGAGHTISGLYITYGTKTSNTGFFGYVGAEGTIQNLTISNSFVSATGNYTGAVVGDLKGRMENCHVTGTTTVQGAAYVGGLVGELDTGGSAAKCSNAGTVTGSAATVGGIAGRVYSALSNALTESFNSGSVTGTSDVGGITGAAYSLGVELKDVYNTGTVEATSAAGTAGGLIGYMRAGTVANAYNTGAVTGGTANGSIAGRFDSYTGLKALNNVHTSQTGLDTVANLNGQSSPGEAAAIDGGSLSQLAAALGEKFAEDALNQNGGYPVLAWQNSGEETDPDAPAIDPAGWDGKASSTAPSQIEGVYQIGSPAELKWFANAAKTNRDIQGVLTENIDLNHQLWTPIGGVTAETGFIGSFDGGGKEITNLYIKSNASAGLFGYNGGEIQNVTVSGLVIGADYAAAVASQNSGSISNCQSNVTVRAGNHAAGITAYNGGGTVSGCTNTGAVSGGQYVAGIAAQNVGQVESCTNTGMIFAAGSFAGGVAGDNGSAAGQLKGTVKNCANSGHVVSASRAVLSCVGGVVGYNNNAVENLYNTGNVESMGSCVGGALGLNTSGAEAAGLYSLGDVTGANVETAEGEDYRIGGAVGYVNSGVSHAYYLNSISVATTTGGTAVSRSELDNKAGSLASMLSVKEAVSGTLTLEGNPEVGETMAAVYTNGNADTADLLYVWHIKYGDDESVLVVTTENTYTIPLNLTGYKLYVKALAPQYSGVVTASSPAIEGMSGTVKISGLAVVGRTLTAVYTGGEQNPNYQWYLGNTPISGAADAAYTVQDGDAGKTLTVRVTGSKAGYVEAKTAAVTTAEEANVWPLAECSEPANVGGVYKIQTEAELKWFASEINGGNNGISAELIADIPLTAANWYPIGNGRVPFHGTFDGGGYTVSQFVLNRNADEQGFFGNVGGNGEVKNLNVAGTVTAAGENCIAAGGIAGYVEGKISACTFTGSVSGHCDAGGIAGQASLNSMITECRNKAAVSGSENLGGIVGNCSYGNVYYCVNNGTVGNSGAVNVGGIAGSMTNYAVITGSYNTGSIAGNKYKGGIAGNASVCAAPQGCYNVGAVEPGLYSYGVLGNLSGTDYITIVHGSFYLAEDAEAATDTTATGAASAAMKASSFVSKLNSEAGTSCFTADKNSANSGYPVLNWEVSGHSGGEGGSPGEDPKPVNLTVTFTLVGDTAHGTSTPHAAYTEWIEKTTFVLKNGSTAYDLFKMALGSDFSYKTTGIGYIGEITNKKTGVTIGELTNGERSGWMYTINGVFPDYMASVKLKNGDDMVFFYTDDYLETGWNPNGKPGESTNTGSADQRAANAVIKQIHDIGKVTAESEKAIQAARTAYDNLTEAQKKLVANYQTLLDAEKEFMRLTGGWVNPFADVSRDDWYYDSVQYVSQNALFDGVSDTEFEPYGTMTRAMMATVLYRLEGEPDVKESSGFLDVADGTWYSDAVSWAEKTGVVNGVSDTEYRPNAKITREQMVSMLYRYAEYKGYAVVSENALSGFDDAASISAYALPAMQWAAENGVIEGVGSGRIDPHGTANRSQVAAVLMRYCEKNVK